MLIAKSNVRLPGFAAARRVLPGLTLLVALLISACQPVAPAAGDTEAASEATAAPAQEAAPTARDGGKLVVYSGRSENLVDPIIQRFAEESRINVEVRYGGTSELASTILEEGDNSPADVFFAQDAGALGALSKAGRLQPLAESVLALVPTDLESHDGTWVGVSGRARVLVYNTDELTEADLPADVWGLTEEQWRGRVGWAPTNASFQSFITAMRVLEGEERASEWLEAMLANDVQTYDSNAPIVAATAAGEISVGLVNHYYLYRFLAEEGEGFAARNYHFPQPHAGSMINVAGVGILTTAANTDAATRFVEFLLSNEAQQFFADETFEYPLAGEGITTNDLIVPINEIAQPELDLGDLDDLEGTLLLLQETGALN
jgi:iron(III) transport system substrate-binding protein